MNYIPHSTKEVREMLDTLGLDRIERLFSHIPEEALCRKELDLHRAMTEPELKRHCEELSLKNRHFSRSFLGGGAYRHYIPSAVNAIISRPEFFTAYTPYQAEASQGTLQAIYEFQSFMCLLLGMDVSNASLYDGSTAVAEASILALNETRRKKLLISEALHPEYREVVKTYLGHSTEIEEIPHSDGITGIEALKGMVDKNVAAVIIQNPNFFGAIETMNEISLAVKAVGALLVTVINEPYSLGVLKSPGSYGTDIAAGECQAFGLPPSFGGPYLGFMATKAQFMRKIPGRLSGKTVDTEGNRGFVLTLQAREQHIRREKAASNICTNEALCALAATVHLSLLGKGGLREAALQNVQKAHYAEGQITAIEGFRKKFSPPFFNEFVIQCDGSAPGEVNRKLSDAGIAGGLELGRFYPSLADCLLFSVTEMNSREDIEALAAAMKTSSPVLERRQA
ncbi:MAG: aminomethyl-transferring glycine dehydrogenase subunit GcvPA [Candidatus Eremiobacteraeota bacterium]|nr:aminomethyl-transferring glycine dehydrogenase subunit GcvPA [Candidatus Eremiobacteraeota bacterium]